MCEGDKVRVWDAVVCGLKHFFLVVWFADFFNHVRVARCFFDGFGGIMWCVGGGVGEGGCSREDASRVDTGELPGFRDRVENLSLCESVDGEIVYGFVGNRPLGIFL